MFTSISRICYPTIYDYLETLREGGFIMKNIKAKYFGDKDFYKMILAIALPIVIQSLFTNFVAMLDNVMVGKVGTDQMTGVAEAETNRPAHYRTGSRRNRRGRIHRHTPASDKGKSSKHRRAGHLRGPNQALPLRSLKGLRAGFGGPHTA